MADLGAVSVCLFLCLFVAKASTRDVPEQERTDDIYHDNGALYYENHRLEKGSQVYIENKETGRYAATITAINNSEVRAAHTRPYPLGRFPCLTLIERLWRHANGTGRCGSVAPMAQKPSCTCRSCARASTCWT